MAAERLSDYGERRIIRELLAPRYAGNTPHFGDDAALLPLAGLPGGSQLVLTTDPCPPPMAVTLGFDDWFFRGWLLATINLSDLAAVGAEPVGLLTSLLLPADTLVADFERLLDGIDSCCERQATAVVGGNLKEAPALELTGTAAGLCDSKPLTRGGAEDGDALVIVGELGRFWAGALGRRANLVPADAGHPLLKPALVPDPQVRAGLAARREDVLASCLDNSDGLYPALVQLAQASGVRVVLEADRVELDTDVAEMAERLDVDPLRLTLGWGDWNLIGTCRTGDLPEAKAVVEEAGSALHHVGRVEGGTGVRLEHAGVEGPLLELDSQRFTPTSWFSSGLDGYIETLLHGPLHHSD